MFAASFDSKMGCLYSVFDVKKQGKPIWEVRTRNWKLREGENRLSGLLEAQNSAFLVLSIDTLSVVSVPNSNTGIWVLVPAREGIGTPCITPGIGTKGGVSVPKPPLGLEYRYRNSSTDTSCLETIFGPP
ncbi:hypothetical protein GQ457_18G005840 [Hibiscus cannabinus]